MHRGAPKASVPSRPARCFSRSRRSPARRLRRCAPAWELSVESYERIEKYLDEDPATWLLDVDAVHRLADALILSGTAMICAGTSRPASGGEHEISHAIDELFSGRALHGAQVAFGCIFSVSLYGEDTDAFRRRLTRLGLP